jgi:MoxR-like ATPase
VQFTSDLLPRHPRRLGVRTQARSFVFHPGPVFTQVLLADEINRAPPRTQSALLEAMAEHQVTIDGEPIALPDPFFVIATQNPVTWPAPTRCPIRSSTASCCALRWAIPTRGRARPAGRQRPPRPDRAGATAGAGADDVLALRRAVRQVHASDALVAYVQALLAAAGTPGRARGPVAARGPGLAARRARARAAARPRRHALPEDVQALFGAVAAHRLVPQGDTTDRVALARSILKSVAVE